MAKYPDSGGPATYVPGEGVGVVVPSYSRYLILVYEWSSMVVRYLDRVVE